LFLVFWKFSVNFANFDKLVCTNCTINLSVATILSFKLFLHTFSIYTLSDSASDLYVTHILYSNERVRYAI
jgi:hypothetical protein